MKYQGWEPIKAEIWYANPSIPWHDPEIPGGKLGEKLIIQDNGYCQLQTLISNRDKQKPLSGKPTENFKIDPEQGLDYLNQIYHILNFISQPSKSKKIANSQTTIWLADGKQIIFKDYKDDENFILHKISMSIRKAIGRADLMVFDGNSHDDFINKITIHYQDQKNNEKVILNAKKETITLQRQLDGVKVKSTFSFENEISTILNELNPSDFVNTIPGIPDNALPETDELGHFTCTIVCENLKPIKISGDYQQYNLPSIWNNLMETIFALTNIPMTGTIVDKHYYKRYRRCKDDLIYLSVSFTHDEYDDRKYNYLTDDDSIQVGDWVLVPVGKENRKQEVLVVGKNYYKKDEVPYPLNKIKRVIGRVEMD